MGKISLEDRKEASAKIMLFFNHKKGQDKLANDQFIFLVYNLAIRDVEDAIDVYIEKNPQHAISLKALKAELEWMPLVR